MGSTFLSLPAKRSISSTTMSSESNSENGSSKRSRPRQPPLTVPPGHVAFACSATPRASAASSESPAASSSSSSRPPAQRSESRNRPARLARPGRGRHRSQRNPLRIFSARKRLRVLNEKLPVCAAPSDEMVEIEGDILAVKKALIAVSGRLQDCPPVEKTRMTGSRPIEAVPRETLSDIRVDHVSQRNSMITSLPSSSMGYASGVGGVIGKGGAIVRALQNETGATISVGGSVAECDERLITITASENPESRYSPAQKAVVLVFSRSVEAGIEKGQDSSSKGSPNARLVVPTSQVGGDQVPKCALENDEVVQVSGDFSNVQDALYNITGRLRDNLFSSTVNNSGRRNSSTLLTDTIPYGRLRDPAPIGFQSSSSIILLHQDHGHHRWLLLGASQIRQGFDFSKKWLRSWQWKQICYLYGENGTNLARLRQISGAKVIVHEPRPGTTDRIIVISGTPDETQAAQSLLHAFILTGPS
ncbi:hypothetical protein M0R45_008658 [Rubus argutus]|uniref:K Homology domain-containing protein n=1 Tax=Rubus argutus TaxID=59490 RepID=A0AAW1Y552_RUBAR